MRDVLVSPKVDKFLRNSSVRGDSEEEAKSVRENRGSGCLRESFVSIADFAGWFKDRGPVTCVRHRLLSDSAGTQQLQSRQ